MSISNGIHSTMSVSQGFEEDMYDSVTVAAFGGVVLQLPGGVDPSVPFRGFGWVASLAA